eukprot:CAMPEP_0116830650 /NCGR_PEP_ID=MMETSP0418-20121206/4878_1 /TAXON_ID=1158023 /ORGANISM="Astrosyne radiata, Strain 13vi08-1A" /LENGTH=239 /DNA_ID=CAMNT_0004459771 /DNA_START=66 /DNA_END=785 /DNA_ORIENTATION=-
MAQDGFMPRMFLQLDGRGNLRSGIWASGILMTILATLCPFSLLNDWISSGILYNCSLIVLKCENNNNNNSGDNNNNHSNSLRYLLCLYNLLCFATSMLLTRMQQQEQSSVWMILFSNLLMLATILTFSYMACTFPKSGGGGSIVTMQTHDAETHFFETPLVPFIPCLGIFCNWYLIAQLHISGLLLLLGYILLITILYCTSARCFVRKNSGWRNQSEEDDESENEEENAIMLSSLPRIS